MRAILLIILLSGKFCFAQINVKNTDLLDPDSSVLFKDMVNHITIEGIKDFTQHQVTIEGGLLTYIGGNTALVTGLSGDKATVIVYRKIKNNRKEIHSAQFKVQDAGIPVVELVEKKDKSFSNGQIINETSLVVKMSNKNYDGDVAVAHFEMSLVDSSGNIIMPSTFISGKYLHKSNYDKILSLASGGKIYFTQVILTYPNGGYMKYKDFAVQKK